MEKKYSLLLLLMFVLFSCNTIKDKTVTSYSKSICEYNVKSISNISISDINASNGISLANRPKVTSILSGTANYIPLEFTINIDIENTGKSDILFTDIDYSIFIEEILFTKRQMTKDFKIPAKGTRTIAFPVKVDIKKMMKTENKDEVAEITKSLIGIGSRKFKMNIMLEPTFKIKNKKFNLSSPVLLNYIIEKK